MVHKQYIEEYDGNNISVRVGEDDLHDSTIDEIMEYGCCGILNCTIIYGERNFPDEMPTDYQMDFLKFVEFHPRYEEIIDFTIKDFIELIKNVKPYNDISHIFYKHILGDNITMDDIEEFLDNRKLKSARNV